MAAPAAKNARSGSPTLLGIGQVLARLTDEFPDLSSSKLRFLEEQGLVSPSRTKSGYRKFTLADVERLRLILSMQRDHYLPLRVIRGYLADLDAGRNPAMPGGANGVVSSIIPTARRYSRADLLRQTGVTAAQLGDAISAGLISAGETYSDESVGVLRALVALHKYGIEARHLRGYRQAAEREVAMIETALKPVATRPDAASRARAAELSGEIASQLDVIRRSLLHTALDRLNP